jgi:probable rRNA maturation factor
MSKADQTIDVEFDTASESVPADLTALERLVRDVCMEGHVSRASVSIRIVEDQDMIQTHRDYMGLETTTDVMSFDLSDEFEPQKTFALVVNAAMAARQARQRGHSAEAELALYVTHGLLHNLGYDDGDDEQARQMHLKEDEILQRHGFGPVYNTKETQRFDAD